MFVGSSILCYLLFLCGITAVKREAPTGTRGLIKRDAPVSSKAVGAQENALDRPGGKATMLHGNDTKTSNGTMLDGNDAKTSNAMMHGPNDTTTSSAGHEPQNEYQGWAAAATLMLKAGWDPDAPPPNSDADDQMEETPQRTSLTTRKFDAGSLVQDDSSSVTLSVDASGSVLETGAAVAVYDETLPEDEQVTFGGRRRARGQNRINEAVRKIQMEVEEAGDPDECYNEWSSWDMWKCVHQDCSSQSNKKRSRKLQNSMSLKQKGIQGCTSKPAKHVHVAYCTTWDTMEPKGITPRFCDVPSSDDSQDGTDSTTPMQVHLDHPGTEEHDYGTLA